MNLELIADGYRPGAPNDEVKAIDAAVAEAYPCRICGGRMRYEGYYRRDGRATSYVALAVCDCGHQVEF